LAALRWPDGFTCPGCGVSKAWRLETKSWTYQCARCGRQTSVTAGTIMHHSKLPLTTWFWAAYVMATQPSGISALQLQCELGLGSYKTAWLLCAKLRRSMLVPDGAPLCGAVEVGTTEIAHRCKSDAGGSSKPAKTPIIGAVEVQDLRLGRLRLGALTDFSPIGIQTFLSANLAPDATAKIADWPDYCSAVGNTCYPQFTVVAAAHDSLTWIRRVFRELEAWISSVPHGLRREHLQSYLDEFDFRFNTRRNRNAGFSSLLGIAAADQPLTCKILVHRKQRRNFGDAATMMLAGACFPLGPLLECCELLFCGGQISTALLA
jgi:hypothetical protein